MNDREAPGAAQGRGALARRRHAAVAPRRPRATPSRTSARGATRRRSGRSSTPAVVPRVRVLDVHSDPDHHRSVITLAGEPLAVQDALVDAGGGVRRPYRPAPPPRRPPAHRARSTSRRSWRSTTTTSRSPREVALRPRRAHRRRELNLPVFLYGAVATDPERVRPRDFRRGGLEELTRLVDEGELRPRRRPAPRCTRRAGAVLVGVRPPADRPQRLAARRHAHRGPRDRGPRARVRRRPAGRARPGPLPARGGHGAGVDEHRGPPRGAARRRRSPPVRAEAERLGIEAGEAELVGLIPSRRAARAAPRPAALGITGFRPGRIWTCSCPARARRPDGQAQAPQERRPAAGPGPKKAAANRRGGVGHRARSSASPGEPLPASFRGVLIRAGIVAAIFYPYLIYVIDENTWTALGRHRHRLRADGPARPPPRPLPLPAADEAVGGAAVAAEAHGALSQGGRRAAAPRGTRDVLPEESRLRQRVIDVARERVRALRLLAHRHADLRGDRGLRARRRAPAPTSCARRCTRSRTRAAAA